MDFVRFRAEYGGSDYIATDVHKVEFIEQMEGDPAFATFRIWYSDPGKNENDFERLEEAFIEEVYTAPSESERKKFTVTLAKSYSDEDVSGSESFGNIEYCRRYYPGGTDFEIILLGESTKHSFTQRGMHTEMKYNEIVELRTV